MTYELILGDRAYSSWSLRGWLLFERFGIAADVRFVSFNDGPAAEQMPDFAPARTVPSARMPDGAIVSDSLAIAEELASRHPDAGLWPADSTARATARSIAAEMHSGFAELREDCPMNLRCAYTGFGASAGVLKDLRRLETIWDHARDVCEPAGPWLCGDYSVVDAFFAPVAARIAGYGLTVSASAQEYVDTHQADPAFRRWRAMALVKGDDVPRYARDYDLGVWPGPAPLAARAVPDGAPENAACPYSGKPVTEFMEIEGRVFGFCNGFCRDKTVVDAGAWPEFMEIYDL
ncbi:MAG: glutathione S-transferase [Paracoccaceae bacterium]